MRSVKRGVMIRDERGATAIIVAVSLVAIMAGAMLSIDAGLMWRQRRIIATSTDAAALSEARKAALSISIVGSCSSTWNELVTRNAGPDAEPISCAVKPGSHFGVGSVEVQARTDSPVIFGKAIGAKDSKPFASSIARYGYVSQMKGLRPIGLCVANTHVAEWVALHDGDISLNTYESLSGMPGHPVYPGAGVVHHVTYTKDQPDACGDKAPGNWGFVDMNGGSNSNADLIDWIHEGYWNNDMGIGDCDANNGVGAELCEADPGSSGGSITGALQDVVGENFALPVFDDVTGSGSTVRYHIAAFIGVTLRGFDVSGSQAQRYMDLEFTSLVVTGNCCLTVGLGPDTGVRSVRLCSVDHDPISESTRCG